MSSLKSWTRSTTHPHAVFLLREDCESVSREYDAKGCAICVFNEPGSGCDLHKCSDGVWLDEIQAATLRLES